MSQRGVNEKATHALMNHGMTRIRYGKGRIVGKARHVHGLPMVRESKTKKKRGKEDLCLPVISY